MSASRCPCCGQVVANRPRVMRFGVPLTPAKARILDVIRRAGAEGIHADDLFGIIYGGSPRKYRALTWAIQCINRQMRGSGWRIQGHTTLKTWRLAEVASKVRAA